MLPYQKAEKIAELQEKKKALKEEVNRAFKRSTDYYHLHKAAEAKYDKLKNQYEALDREEKFLSINITRETIKDPTKPKEKKVTPVDPKAQALKALNNLPPAVRAKIIAGFNKKKENE
jgi:hypothetical protein